ncbi:hypothetical protein Aperf_G00000006832 [Anoplocephala perfoliata]
MMLRSFEHMEIIYQSEIFNLSSMINVAILYGNSHPDIVGIIFASVFKENSKFVNDAVSLMACFVTSLSRVEKKIASWQFDEKHQLVAPSCDSLDMVSEVIDYIVEAGCNLGAFLFFLGPVNSSVADLCIRSNIVSSLATFYNSAIVNIQDHILRCLTWSSEKKSELLSRLAIAAASLVKTVRVGLIEPGLVNRIMHLAYGGSSANSSQALTNIFAVFIDVMLEMLNHNEFARAYAQLYPVVDDINLIREAASSTNVDMTQLDYLESAFAHLAEEFPIKQVKSDDIKKVEEVEPSKADTSASQDVEKPQPGCSRSVEFRTLKAVLPDAEDDLIERCLEYYKNDTQAIITALLDGSVPLSVSNPELAKPIAPEFKAEQLWQGKRQNAATLQPLSAEDKLCITNLAVSVWDDEDAIGGYNYGDTYDNGENATENRMNDIRGVDLVYDDEYDDTFEGETGVDIERTEEDEAENAETMNTVKLKTSSGLQAPAFPSQGGDRRGVHQKHRYRQESSFQEQRQQPQRNVLQIEDPEDVRQRRQQKATVIAARKGRVDITPRPKVPPQPSVPEISTTEMAEASPSLSRSNYSAMRNSEVNNSTARKDRTNLNQRLNVPSRPSMAEISAREVAEPSSSSRPNYSTMKNSEDNNSTTQYRGSGYNRGRSYNRSRGGNFTVGRGRGTGHGDNVPSWKDDAYARRLKERYGAHGDQHYLADQKRRPT